MTVGKTLWKIIIIKLFVIFAVFKFFFFPDIMEQQYDTDAQKANHVLRSLTLPVSAARTPIHDTSTIK
jgi:hypothetical protein